MFNQMFGAYLVGEEVITQDRLTELLRKASDERVKLGTIAVAEGFLTEKETEDINRLQAQQDKRFGDIAIENGYLTQEQVEEMLAKQGNPFMQFLQLLFEGNFLSPSELEWRLEDFQDQQGFTEEDMEALKAEDVDRIVSLFAFASKPYVTEVVGLLLRNITRFITDDYYIGHIERTDEIVSNRIVMQRTFGDHFIYLGLAADEKEEGFVEMACGYADENYKEVDDFVYDALCEFVNTTIGLFATNLSHQKISMDMEPPKAYANQIVQGSAYIVPLYIHQNRVNIYVSVDCELMFARKPLELNIEKRQGSSATIYSKASVVIVDDSALTRKILRQLLEDQGYTVVCEAVDGVEAIDAYKKYHPDLITLDITMPVMDGVDALRQIMEFDPKTNAVMITAAGQEKRVIEALRLGAKQFVVKPFNKDEIIKSIDKIIEEKA